MLRGIPEPKLSEWVAHPAEGFCNLLPAGVRVLDYLPICDPFPFFNKRFYAFSSHADGRTFQYSENFQRPLEITFFCFTDLSPPPHVP